MQAAETSVLPQRSHEHTIKNEFPEGEQKEFDGFPYGYLHIKTSWDAQHVYS